MMRVCGRITREGRFWVADIPILDASTQGRTKAECLDMAKDLVESLVNEQGFKVIARQMDKGSFELSASTAKEMTSLILKRQRGRSGLSLAEAATRLGSSSRNAYARYEQGRSVPSVEKLAQLLKAVAPDRDILIDLS